MAPIGCFAPFTYILLVPLLLQSPIRQRSGPEFSRAKETLCSDQST
jgi:hypothetical protein